MTRLLYIVGGAVGMVIAMAGVVGLTWLLDRAFGIWGTVALAAVGVAVQGGLFGVMLYRARRR
jgi:hypothetical protein